MIATMFTSYPRTLTVVAALLALLTLVYGGAMEAVYPSLLGVFEWLETTWFGVIGKTWGAAFALVEAVHLLGLALLGGCVLASDGRLLGVVLALAAVFPASVARAGVVLVAGPVSGPVV